MSIQTTTVDLTYRYLMNKSKSDLAYMVLDYARMLQEETARNTPRPTYGIKVIVDTELNPGICEIHDKYGLIHKIDTSE